jgi:2-hydroxychromene-2-carboxylate isomerase
MDLYTTTSAQPTVSAQMKSIVFYLDFKSAEASLAFQRLPDVLRGLSYSISFKPVWFGDLRNPLGSLNLLHLAVACDAVGTPNRFVCETIFLHVRTLGPAALEPTHLAALSAQLAPVQDVTSARVRQQLKAHTDEAIARGVLTVPSWVVDGKVFSGLDALSRLRD